MADTFRLAVHVLAYRPSVDYRCNEQEVRRRRSRDCYRVHQPSYERGDGLSQEDNQASEGRRGRQRGFRVRPRREVRIHNRGQGLGRPCSRAPGARIPCWYRRDQCCCEVGGTSHRCCRVTSATAAGGGVGDGTCKAGWGAGDGEDAVVAAVAGSFLVHCGPCILVRLIPVAPLPLHPSSFRVH